MQQLLNRPQCRAYLHSICNVQPASLQKPGLMTCQHPSRLQQACNWRQRHVHLEATRLPSVEAAALLNAGHIYMDVRTPEEFAAGHAVGSVNIPFLLKNAEGQLTPNPDFLQQVKQTFPDLTEPLVVGCRSGNRSAKACALLEEQLQYSNLTDDAGGWLGWVEAQLPTEP